MQNDNRHNDNSHIPLVGPFAGVGAHVVGQRVLVRKGTLTDGARERAVLGSLNRRELGSASALESNVMILLLGEKGESIILVVGRK